jgi:FkbM family methyltransferase
VPRWLDRIEVGNRSKRAVLRAPFQRAHYRALAGMALRYPAPLQNLRRFLTGKGTYPYRCPVRTPLGVVAPTLHTSHDISTVNEVFCRLDYRAPTTLRVAVDIGSNIGISALYFLTRNPTARVYLFEPDPKNVARLRENLTGFEDRYELDGAAIGVSEGEVSFCTEPTGRYGRIGKDFGDVITVRCRSVNAVLAAILKREGRVDLLKIDIEGTEEEVVAAIRPDLLEHIDAIYYETCGPAPLHTDRFSHRYETQTNRLLANTQPPNTQPPNTQPPNTLLAYLEAP